MGSGWWVRLEVRIELLVAWLLTSCLILVQPVSIEIYLLWSYDAKRCKNSIPAGCGMIEERKLQRG